VQVDGVWANIAGALPALIWATDAAGVVTFASDAARETLGLTVGVNTTRDAAAIFAGISGQTIRTLSGEATSNSAFTMAGNFAVSMTPSMADDGRVTGMTAVAVRIAGRPATAEATVGGWRLNVTTGDIVASPELYDILGLEGTLTLDRLLACIHDDDRQDFSLNLSRVRTATDAFDMAHRMVRQQTGEIAFVRSRVERIASGGVTVGISGTMTLAARSATERLPLNVDLGLNERLAKAISLADRNGDIVAIIALGPDSFEDVIDDLGFTAADAVMAEIMHRLEDAMRPSDTIVRRYGQHILMVLPDVRVPEQLTALMDRIRRRLRLPFAHRDRGLRITASAGIALHGTDGSDPAVLVQKAFRALHRASAEGKDTFRYYSDEMQTQVEKRLSIDQALRRSIEGHAFRVFYQPIVSFEKRRAIGFEALARWPEHEGDPVSPRDFITVAEESGQIVALGEQILEKALADIVSLGRAYNTRVDVAVNVSARQLQNPGFPGMLRRAIRSSGIDPFWLELELTETALLTDCETSMRVISTVRHQGIGVAIDDFGTGYNSLHHLRTLPLTTLKLDASFVHGIGFDPNSESIVQSIIELAHKCNVRVIAEGVETNKQISALSDYGCDAYQGFAFSPPVSIAHCGTFIADTAAASAPTLRPIFEIS
jgi:diguanylate cyclase (GGDEF)-like protein